MLDGTTITVGGVVFTQEQLYKKLPLPEYENKVIEHIMSQGSSGTGFKVLQPTGVRYKSIEVNVGHVEVTDASSIEALYLAENPFTLTIAIPSVLSNSYRVMFDDNGLTTTLPELAEYTTRCYELKMVLKIIDKL